MFPSIFQLFVNPNLFNVLLHSLCTHCLTTAGVGVYIVTDCFKLEYKYKETLSQYCMWLDS